jgi:subtilase family serine protease
MPPVPRSGRFPKRTVATVATLATVIGLCLTGFAPASAAARVSFAGSVPSWAVSSRLAGTPAADTTIELEVFLPLRNAAGAAALATAVATPGSSAYRHPVTPTQWINSFSPTPADSAALVALLKKDGLSISAVPASRQYVVARGTAAQINAIFATSLRTYNYAGRRLIAPSSAPSLPASIAHKVSGISIDQSRALTKPNLVKRVDAKKPAAAPKAKAKSTSSAKPPLVAVCSDYFGQHTATRPAAYGKTVFPTDNCGYTPAQLRSAYGLTALSKAHVNGKGQKVAIIDAYASPTILKDANTYSAALGEPLLSSATYSQIVPTPSQFRDIPDCQGPASWQGEQTLDVEAVHGMAPGASILYVGGNNCLGGLDVALSKILDKKLATIVSNSYGNVGEALPADVLVGENNLYIQAAGEGIGLYFSSGDNGDEAATLGEPSPDFPASSPYVTAVGGTAIGVGKDGELALETGWGDLLDQVEADPYGQLRYDEKLPGTLYGGSAGGGTSAVFAEPAYQKGVVPSSLSRGFRVMPDVASLADPFTGFLVGLRPILDDTTLKTGPFSTDIYGGTSVASPLTAGEMAVVQQATHITIGFANPTLYALDRVAPSSFRDVAPPSSPLALAYTGSVSGDSYLITLNDDTSLRVTHGYDNVTGLGQLKLGSLTAFANGRH